MISLFQRTALAAVFALLAVNTTISQAQAPASPPDPAATSVEAMGWMKGFPPPPDPYQRRHPLIECAPATRP